MGIDDRLLMILLEKHFLLRGQTLVALIVLHHFAASLPAYSLQLCNATPKVGRDQSLTIKITEIQDKAIARTTIKL